MVKFADLKEDADRFAAGFCKALNENPNYEAAGKGWKGALLLVMKACGEIEDDIVAFLDVEEGKCKRIIILGPGEEPPFEPVMTITGSMYLWRELAFKEKDPIQSLMSGALVLEGDTALAMRYARATMELANSAEKADRTILTKYDLGTGVE
ncbi:MAG: SCP2 sterol-binding domain-containing protein [Candidatus Helarchaeota archaeon]